MPGALQTPSTPIKAPQPPNIDNVILGNLSIKPWYSSFYPKEQSEGSKLANLYVCQWCFKYTHEVLKHCTHQKLCEAQHEPPVGDTIYEKDGYAIHELDGDENKLYAQNLSLFAKLFLDTKSVFFDVSSFLYYTLVSQGRVIGFFSKEKLSWDNNNLACILVFPPWQRRGLGQVLMGASYVLGKREERFGGPERPLSAPGQKAYIAFWCGEVCRYILTAPMKRAITIKAISEDTWILPEDIVTALKEMEVYEKRKTPSGNVTINKAKVRTWAQAHRVSLQAPVDAEAFTEQADSTDHE